MPNVEFFKQSLFSTGHFQIKTFGILGKKKKRIWLAEPYRWNNWDRCNKWNVFFEIVLQRVTIFEQNNLLIHSAVFFNNIYFLFSFRPRGGVSKGAWWITSSRENDAEDCLRGDTPETSYINWNDKDIVRNTIRMNTDSNKYSP